MSQRQDWSPYPRPVCCDPSFEGQRGGSFVGGRDGTLEGEMEELAVSCRDLSSVETAGLAESDRQRNLKTMRW